jgi:hypothetical protein
MGDDQVIVVRREDGALRAFLNSCKIELRSWYFAEQEASAAWKEEVLKCGIQNFAMSGLFEEDDAEIWASVIRGTKGSIARRYTSDFRAGFSMQPFTDVPGPGTAYHSLLPDCEQFNLLMNLFSVREI